VSPEAQSVFNAQAAFTARESSLQTANCMRCARMGQKTSITVEDLNIAHSRAMWFDATVQDQLRPFARNFKPAETVYALNRAGRIGTVTDLPPMPTRRTVGRRKAESINAALVA
jgi:hypothetical protein